MNAEPYYYAELLIKGTDFLQYSSIIKPCSFFYKQRSFIQTLTSRICLKYFIGTFLMFISLTHCYASEETSHETFRW